MIKRFFKCFCKVIFVLFVSIICLGTSIINPIFIKNEPIKYCNLNNCCASFDNIKNFGLNKQQLRDLTKSTNLDLGYKTNLEKVNSDSLNFLKNSVSLKNFFNFNNSSSFPNIGDFIQNIFKKNEKSSDEKIEKTYVYLGGYPLGFTINCKGVLVVAISNESNSDIQVGDIITKIENEEITSVTQILNILNQPKNKNKKVNVEFTRNGEIQKTELTPIFDKEQKIYKLGFWVRDNSAGVGTLTYIRKDNLRFGALGHPVCDIDTGKLMPAHDGNIFKCNIVGYKKGVRGNAGELRGLFLRNGSMLGSLDKNNNFGVYGNFDEKFIAGFSGDLVEVAGRNEVKSGKAKIRCTIDGVMPEEYEIEIVKTYFQNSESNKSMFIRVTDERLLKTTGGIVQGMSGSPIIQNGKLVGAVTHVFVSDPTKGYGVYADWMINN